MMIHEATLRTESMDKESVARALQVDNLVNMKNLKINTEVEGKKIVTTLKTNSIKTLLNTLDDLIYCQMVAEKSL
jgi:hypothetical protein